MTLSLILDKKIKLLTHEQEAKYRLSNFYTSSTALTQRPTNCSKTKYDLPALILLLFHFSNSSHRFGLLIPEEEPSDFKMCLKSTWNSHKPLSNTQTTQDNQGSVCEFYRFISRYSPGYRALKSLQWPEAPRIQQEYIPPQIESLGPESLHLYIHNRKSLSQPVVQKLTAVENTV